MTATNFNLYLERMKVNGELLPDLNTLIYLQRQHLLHVPFENLDIFYRKPIALNVDTFFDKMVLNRRGGYCYECNGLFHELLTWVGFDARIISCRVFNGKSLGEPYDHLAIIVTFNGTEWLVDAGFGDFSVKPLRLDLAQVQSDGRSNFKVEPYGEVDGEMYDCVSRQKSGKEQFLPVYLLSRKPQSLTDFSGMNRWHQSAAESHFTRQMICSLLTEEGRISLVSNRVIITHGQSKEEKFIAQNAVKVLLVSDFGMNESNVNNLMQSTVASSNQ